jgi:energy-coupling factor transport system ATP-binding protein
MEFLLSLNRDRGISLLLITHDMHLMLEYAVRAVVLSEGSCVADAEPFDVLTDEGIIEKASLKRTSLYDIAVKAGIPDPRSFVSRYIRYDRRRRPEYRPEYRSEYRVENAGQKIPAAGPVT